MTVGRTDRRAAHPVGAARSLIDPSPTRLLRSVERKPLLLQRLAEIELFEPNSTRRELLAAMTRGLLDARRLIEERIRSSKRGDNGWVSIKAGEWGNKYLNRAATAEYAIYANRAVSSLYPEIHVDQIGDPLVGSRRYVLRFDKGQLPPVSDFWSITVYRGDTLTLTANPIKRYSIGDRTPGLKIADDGSLTIYIQKDSPGKDKEANWLPSPAGEFNLMCRCYGPQPALLADEYKLPPVKRVE